MDWPLLFLRIAALAALILFAAGLARRLAIYRRGKPRRLPILRALAAIPRRYLVDLHKVVARDPFTARMHILVAAGFVAALLCLAVSLVAPQNVVTHMAGAVSAAVMIAGAALVIWRRHGRGGRYPAARSRGEWSRIGFSATLFAGGLLAWFASGGSGAVAAAASLLLVVGFVDMIVGAAWFSAMRHATVGALNLGFHPRPERFSDREGRDNALRALDLDAEKLGVERAEDFDWTRILNFDACVQCGRCEAACPAFAAGQPLNPKALVFDLVSSAGLAKMAGPYRGSPHPGLDATAGRHEAGEAILGRFIAPETVWACTTCRACVDECPMMIEHVDAVVDLRRFATLETGSVPGQAGEVLDSYQRYDTPGGRDPTGRFDWASGLGIPVLSEGQESDVLLWVGEAGFDGRGQRTLRATVALLREAGVDFAVLGSEERDTGDLARRLGDEATFQRLARRNVLTLSRRRFRRIVTNDPHVRHALAVEYPAFGGRYEVLHHTQLLRELLREGRLRIRRRVGSALTYHDPCYLGRYAGEYDAPREILAAIGADIREMGRARHRSRCCGGGGGAPVTDIPGKRRIPDMRMDDARSVGAATVAVACPTCAVMLEGTTGEGPEVADIAELVAAAVFAAEAPS